MAEEYPANVYGKAVPWEIPVQLCMKDFVKEGDCVFDVGANIGGVTIALSRMVGPKGQVHSFEANPFLLPRIKKDLDANKITNVILNPKAVWSAPNQTLSFYCEKSYYAAGSSLLRKNQDSVEVKVDTVSLDDYCRDLNIIPKVIKVDVEGAELQVLRGGEEILRRNHPVIVLEYTTSPTDPKEDSLEYLNSLGYVLFDTNLYTRVGREFYLSEGSIATVNVLAIPENQFKFSPYNSLIVTKEQTIDIKKDMHQSEPILLGRSGRYMITFTFDGPPTIVSGLSIKTDDGEQLGYYETQIQYLKHHSCSHMIFEIEKPTKVICEISGNDLSDVILNKVEVSFIDIKKSYSQKRKFFEFFGANR